MAFHIEIITSIYKKFCHNRLPEVVCGVEKTWPQQLLQLQGHNGCVCSVAFQFGMQALTPECSHPFEVTKIGFVPSHSRPTDPKSSLGLMTILFEFGMQANGLRVRNDREDLGRDGNCGPVCLLSRLNWI